MPNSIAVASEFQYNTADSIGIVYGAGSKKSIWVRSQLMSGEHKLDGAVTFDIKRQYDPIIRMNVVGKNGKSDLSSLPANVYDETNFINPYPTDHKTGNPIGWKPVNPETVRITKPGGMIVVSGKRGPRGNRYALPLSNNEADQLGVVIIYDGPILPEHMFGQTHHNNGNVLQISDYSAFKTTVYQKK